MQGHLHCAEQQESPSNLTKYCACHKLLILVPYETSFTISEATDVILQRCQILCLPRKITLMIDPCHIWNVIYNARSNRSHPPTSPNIVPATKNDVPKFERNLLKTDETSCAMYNARPIRPWSEHEPTSPQPAAQPRLLFALTTSIFYWKIQHFTLRLPFQISPNNTAPATKSDSWTSPNTAPATKSDSWTSPNTAPATKSDSWTPPN